MLWFSAESDELELEASSIAFWNAAFCESEEFAL
jgi:hypothetical protein